tara:strand:- start:287 stop:598 length:312 start_codon:yes stop_codon:yes gene_type:complete
MAVETAVERAIFFGVNDFGTAATYTPAGGSPSTVNGIFDHEAAEADAGGSVSVIVEQPRFVCQTSLIPLAAENDAIIIDTISYVVRVVFADGTGTTQLFLERV